jgi:hypothetical protein
MIVFARSANIAGGKIGSAVAFAHEIASYVKDKHGLELEVLMPIGGNPNRIAWSSRYNSLADLEAMTANLLGDQDYLALVSANADNFIAGSLRDTIWRSM